MAKGIPTDPALKAEILRRIKNEGLSVPAASEQYQISTKAIYSWIRNNGTTGSERNLILENNQLKKKLDNAYRVIGKLTAEVSRPKG